MRVLPRNDPFNYELYRIDNAPKYKPPDEIITADAVKLPESLGAKVFLTAAA